VAEKGEKVESAGEVTETLGHFFGRFSRHRIRHTLGDQVRIELSQSDLRRGGIVYRVG
jgi:translation initiation factor IF-1